MAGTPSDLDEGRLDALVARVVAARGDVVALKLDPDPMQELVWRLVNLEAENDFVDARMVLGSACTTALKAVEQFT